MYPDDACLYTLLPLNISAEHLYVTKGIILVNCSLCSLFPRIRAAPKESEILSMLAPGLGYLPMLKSNFRYAPLIAEGNQLRFTGSVGRCGFAATTLLAADISY
jgi:hypothetical protein